MKKIAILLLAVTLSAVCGNTAFAQKAKTQIKVPKANLLTVPAETQFDSLATFKKSAAVDSGKALYIKVATSAVAATTPFIRAGAGTPEGAITAPIGSVWLRTDGSTSTSIYIKTSGSGNTGWTAK